MDMRSHQIAPCHLISTTENLQIKFTGLSGFSTFIYDSYKVTRVYANCCLLIYLVTFIFENLHYYSTKSSLFFDTGITHS